MSLISDQVAHRRGVVGIADHGYIDGGGGFRQPDGISHSARPSVRFGSDEVDGERSVIAADARADIVRLPWAQVGGKP